MRSILSFSVLALAATIGLSSCGGSPPSTNSGSPTGPSDASGTPTPTSGSVVIVSIVGSDGNQAFQPNPVAANTGDTLVFRNNDTTTHDIVMNDGSASFGVIAPGASRSATLRSQTGSFHCTIHPTMVGSVNGATAPTPPDCTTPGSCDGY